MTFWINIIVLGLILCSLIILIVIINYIYISRRSYRNLQKDKNELISLASHQLRGPLSVIQGYTSMILEGDYGKVPAKIREPLTRAFQSGVELGFLVNDYLNVSNINHGVTKIAAEKFNLVQLLHEVCSEFRFVTEKTKVELVIEFNTNSEINIVADRNKTRQIFANVLDNAFKYTPKGEITIRCRKKKDSVLTSIKDTGIGIKKENIDRIFNRFARSRTATKINVTGSGLGLFVAKNMAESQGGTIWVESSGLGKGSTFYVSLPIKK